MKYPLFLIVLAALLVTGCDWIDEIIDPEKELIEITVSKLRAAPSDEITITLFNRGEKTVFLEGCNQIYYSTKSDTGWVDHTMVVCVWEGYEVPVPAGSAHTQKFVVPMMAGTLRFYAPVYRGCKPDLPISQAECVTMHRYYSPDVVVYPPRVPR